MNNNMWKMGAKCRLAVAVLACSSAAVQAYPLIESDSTQINLDVEAVMGVFSSGETYGNSNSSPSWTEGYIKYGFSGAHQLNQGEVFGAINAVTSGTWGDGDASGATTGKERKTDLEDLFLGYRSDFFEVSVGRQNITIGDGFLLNGDGLNLGKGAGPEELNRGGAYWLAPRKAFDKTALVRLGGDLGVRSDLFWFESDNVAQGKPEMAGINIEHVSELGVVGFMHLKGLDVDDVWGNPARDGQKTTSLRYQGSAGVDNLFLSAEYVHQSQGDNSGSSKAWYAEAGWTFADLSWSPSVNYRYTRYNTGYDPLFFGFNRGYGTWFQGEVAANYAGPFGTDSVIHYLGVTAQPADLLSVGVGYFDFNKTIGGSGDNDARELNFWAEWVVNDHLILSPLIGFYKPDSANGTQGSTKLNTYGQIMAVIPF
ncbi:alginate export family protein [Nitrincola alkalisediminis]|uniref:alginate export family protein n=1 Tax=Nitrincola alkalisediminis TaxID=1366656 RepID=UPI001FE98CE9|nr:alginate export family protein [Nitrincola alkalisediminis]